jgi:hypothetical protein
LTTFLTMGLMVWTYSWFSGMVFALGLVVLILVHGSGTGRRPVARVPRGRAVFVRFFGAFIALRDRVRTTFQDFVIGAGGPLAGTAGGVVTILLGRLTDPGTGALLYVVGYFTLVIKPLQPPADRPARRRPHDGARHAAGWGIGAGLLLLSTVHAAGMSGELQAMPSILVLVVVVMAVRAALRARGAAPATTRSSGWPRPKRALAASRSRWSRAVSAGWRR